MITKLFEDRKCGKHLKEQFKDQSYLVRAGIF